MKMMIQGCVLTVDGTKYVEASEVCELTADFQKNFEACRQIGETLGTSLQRQGAQEILNEIRQ